MKIGIITDIHNNLIALEAVLNEIENSCDFIICCGDIIGIGPYPDETVQRMMKIKNLIAVKGNHERYLLEGTPNEIPNEEHMDIEEMKHHKWEHKQLSNGSIDFLKTLPYSIKFEIEGKKIFITHYAMNDDNKYTSFCNSIEKLFSSVDADIIIYGHNHSKNICNSDKLYINVGSLGCPANDRNIARYGVLEIKDENVNIETKELKYDSQTVINKINELNYPASDEIKRLFYGISD